jgi:Rha family phage regulatory protein
MSTNIASFNDIYGVTEKKGKAIVTSLKVAEIFEKRHDHVLRDIQEIIEGLLKNEDTSEKITAPNFGVSKNFTERNFTLSNYKDSTGRKLPMYEMSRDGFALLAMGFTGDKALKFKIAYVNRFNEMEEFIENISLAKVEFPEFTEAIQAAHEEPRPYHFSNEIDMINRIVLGMPAKKFKEVNNIPAETASIRPYLSNFQIEAIRKLQRLDIGLIEAGLDYETRKEKLTSKFRTLSIKAIAC